MSCCSIGLPLLIKTSCGTSKEHQEVFNSNCSTPDTTCVPLVPTSRQPVDSHASRINSNWNGLPVTLVTPWLVPSIRQLDAPVLYKHLPKWHQLMKSADASAMPCCRTSTSTARGPSDTRPGRLHSSIRLRSKMCIGKTMNDQFERMVAHLGSWAHAQVRIKSRTA